MEINKITGSDTERPAFFVQLTPVKVILSSISTIEEHAQKKLESKNCCFSSLSVIANFIKNLWIYLLELCRCNANQKSEKEDDPESEEITIHFEQRPGGESYHSVFEFNINGIPRASIHSVPPHVNSHFLKFSEDCDEQMKPRLIESVIGKLRELERSKAGQALIISQGDVSHFSEAEFKIKQIGDKTFIRFK